jgi:phage repressor protein C with HTH and peptisase S24 domain
LERHFYRVAPVTIGARIAERLEALGGEAEGFSQAWLAREIGVTQPTINALIRNPGAGTKHLTKIARALRTTSGYLEGEIDDPDAGAILPPSSELLAEQLGLQMIPEVDIAYSMGGGSVVDDYADVRMVPFRRDWLSRLTHGRPSDVALTRGIGDSMMPTILDDDDVLMDRADRTIRQQDRIWALAYGDLGMIKRVRRLPSGVFQLNSDNQAVTPIEATQDELYVVGRVIWIGRKV